MQSLVHEAPGSSSKTVAIIDSVDFLHQLLGRDKVQQ